MLYQLDQFYDHWPLVSVASSLAAAAILCLALGRFAMPAAFRAEFRPGRGPARYLADQGLRVLVVAFIYAVFFVISWRPAYSFLGTLSFFVVFGGISRAKFIFIREPLIFSDIALVVDVFKYKEIFYATWANSLFWVFAVVYVFGLSTLFYIFEPTVLPADGWAFHAALGCALFVSSGLLLFWKPVRRLLSRLAARCVGEQHLRRNTLRFGTFEYVALSFLIWFGKVRQTFVDEIAHELDSAVHTLFPGREREAPLLVVWQSESFIDMRRFGRKKLRLPNVDKLRKRAALWGKLGSVFEGGYTLRTEFAVLSGLKPDDVGLDASYPYLRAQDYSAGAWPLRLKKAGWNTHFMHPYDRTFFMRHRAIPELGFKEMTMLDAFDHQPSAEEPYVTDAQLTRRVIKAVRRIKSDEAALLFVASMGNHGPWQEGRAGRTGDAVSIYCSLLRDADKALGKLAEELDAMDRPVWLVFYGDHAPLLKAFADPFPDPRTDYLIVPLGTAERRYPESEVGQVQPWDLLDRLAELAGLRTAEPGRGKTLSHERPT